MDWIIVDEVSEVDPAVWATLNQLEGEPVTIVADGTKLPTERDERE